MSFVLPQGVEEGGFIHNLSGNHPNWVGPSGQARIILCSNWPSQHVLNWESWTHTKVNEYPDLCSFRFDFGFQKMASLRHEMGFHDDPYGSSLIDISLSH